jgi:hypothetical protein
MKALREVPRKSYTDRPGKGSTPWIDYGRMVGMVDVSINTRENVVINRE